MPIYEFVHFFEQSLEEVNKFLEAEQPFEDYCEMVAKYDKLAQLIPCELAHVVTMGLYDINREELIDSIATQATTQRDSILTRMVNDYQHMCKR